MEKKALCAGEKAVIQRRHLLEKEPISKPCDEVRLQPRLFYRRQEFFENGSLICRFSKAILSTLTKKAM
jgi:hypothetical protein